MNVHVEYTDFKTFRNYFSVLHKKYSTSINGFTLYFDKKYSHKPFKFLRKKFGNLHFVIRATSLNKTLVDLCNRMRIELTVKITAPLSKGTRELMKNLHRAVVVYNQTDDVATQTFLTENEQFLVCTENENALPVLRRSYALVKTAKYIFVPITFKRVCLEKLTTKEIISKMKIFFGS